MSYIRQKTLQKPQLTIILNETLWQAIFKLPEIQRKRFILYYELEFTYEQIAKIEKCSKTAVKYSIDKAKATIIKKIKNF